MILFNVMLLYYFLILTNLLLMTLVHYVKRIRKLIISLTH